MDVYRSTETYTTERWEDMGVILIRVTNSAGMVTAVLSEAVFLKEYSLITP